MKIVHKIIIANVLNILLIALTGFFAYHKLEIVLAKLKFVEIADDLNASFLQMRLSEKNLFLYGDKSALPEIQASLKESEQTIDLARPDVLRAIGPQKLGQLETGLDAYRTAIRSADAETGDGAQLRIREAGQKLQGFSRYLTDAERKEISKIITDSRSGLFYSLCLILVTAVGITHLISIKVLRSLKQIEKITHHISEGDFKKIESHCAQDECGLVIGALNSMVEELQEREEQIIQAKKLASIGILTAGIAHEVGNPLNNISMLAQTYMELYDNLSREDRIDFMKKVEEETERIQRIVKDLLDFSKPKKPNLSAMSVNDVVQKSMRLVYNMICVSNVEVRLCLQDDLPSVLIDEHQIQEVLINLLTNALHASSPGDSLCVLTRFNAAAGHVEIEVEDNGKGIAPELLPHIFDPFFTTKGSSGTGLGLFVSYGIVKNHGGDLKVLSELGKGTSFIIELPECVQNRSTA